MPLLVHQEEVRLELKDMTRRIVLERDVQNGYIVPPSRASGLHLSGLLKYVAYTSRITARMQEIADEEMPLRWMLGHAFEEFAASLCVDMKWQPGETDTPCIMNCDGITFRDDLDGDTFCVNEFKCNRSKRYSAHDLIEKKWLWMCQGRGYCCGYGTCHVEWNVLSVMEWPDPVWTRYLIRFTDEELDGMMQMIKANYRAAVKAGYAE